MRASRTPGVLHRASRRALGCARTLLAAGLILAAAGCRAPVPRPGATQPSASAQPGPVVLYPGHAAPGRVVALRPITGSDAPQTKPPGALRRAITGETSQPSPVSRMSRPLSLAVRSGKILVCDTGRRALVQVDPRHDTMQTVELHGLIGDLDPVAVAVDSKSNAYVADVAGKRVLQISSVNSVLRTYTLPAGTPFVPIDLAVSADRLYAVNRASRLVEAFDLDTAKPLGPFGDPEKGMASFPVAVSLDVEGRLYVVDMVSSRVRVYDRAGQMVREFGGAGDRPGLFAQPRSVAVGPDGVTYVSDVATHIVQVFDPAGVLLMYFGGVDGSIGGMGMPAKVVTDEALLDVFASQMPLGFEPKYMILVADQVGPPRIGVYAFGQLSQTDKEASPP
jgi:streptogramin lyase